MEFYDDSEEDSLPENVIPNIIDLHEHQFVCVPREIPQPIINNAYRLAHKGLENVIRTEHGAMYEICQKRNQKVQYGSIYVGFELTAELKRYRRVHIQIVDIRQYYAHRARKSDDLLNAIAIVQNIPSHQNIAAQIDCCQCEKFLYSVVEFGGEDLFSYITLHSDFQEYNNSHRQFIFEQILTAVEYIQSLGLYHRDLSVDNFVYDHETRLVKLIDFGMALILPTATMPMIREQLQLMGLDVNPYPQIYPHIDINSQELIPLLIPDQGFQGKWKYAPPEMYAEIRCASNGFLADNWSLGVILYFLLTGRLPWNYPIMSDPFFRHIQQGHLEDMLAASAIPIPVEARHLLHLLLTAVAPEDRLSVSQMRSQAWLSGDV